MHLRVKAKGQGRGEGTHVSLFVHLMRGEYDNRLKWPFRGHITVKLLNQRSEKQHGRIGSETLSSLAGDQGQAKEVNE